MRELEGLLYELGNGDPEAYVLDGIAEGKSLRSIAAALAPQMSDQRLSPAQLYIWRDIEPGRFDRWTAAFKAAANHHVEEGLELLDKTAEKPRLTSADASLANARAQYRYKLAQVYDRATFGDSPTTQIVLNANDLHLTAIGRVVALGGGSESVTQPASRAPETLALPAGQES